MADAEDDDSNTPPPVDPDTQCAVGIVSRPGARCTVRLDCRRHSLEQKQAVSDRSRPFDELLQALALATADIRSRNPQQRRPRVLDLEVHCGVEKTDSTQCLNALTCINHTKPEKDAVSGRSTSFNELLRLYAANHQRGTGGGNFAVDRDTQCAVLMSNGQRCTHTLKCAEHTKAQKRAVEDRSIHFDVLLRIQATQTSSAVRTYTGYGLVVAPASGRGNITAVRRVYRKNGMQAAT